MGAESLKRIIRSCKEVLNFQRQISRKKPVLKYFYIKQILLCIKISQSMTPIKVSKILGLAGHLKKDKTEHLWLPTVSVKAFLHCPNIFTFYLLTKILLMFQVLPDKKGGRAHSTNDKRPFPLFRPSHRESRATQSATSPS